MAHAVLDAFNDAAQSRYTLQPDRTLSMIVGRLRAYPDVGLDEHRAIVAASFARPWWRDRPSPAVIYGNDAVFERAREEARHPTRPPETLAERTTRIAREVFNGGHDERSRRSGSDAAGAELLAITARVER